MYSFLLVHPAYPGRCIHISVGTGVGPLHLVQLLLYFIILPLLLLFSFALFNFRRLLTHSFLFALCSVIDRQRSQGPRFQRTEPQNEDKEQNKGKSEL